MDITLAIVADDRKIMFYTKLWKLLTLLLEAKKFLEIAILKTLYFDPAIYLWNRPDPIYNCQAFLNSAMR